MFKVKGMKESKRGEQMNCANVDCLQSTTEVPLEVSGHEFKVRPFNKVLCFSSATVNCERYRGTGFHQCGVLSRTEVSIIEYHEEREKQVVGLMQGKS